MKKVNRETQLAALHTQIKRCTKCDLCKTRKNAVPGEGVLDAGVMIIGEAPGRVNDETGRPFVGLGGKILYKILGHLGVDKDQLFLTNAIKCWPPDNRKPTKEEVELCKNHLEEQVRLVQPKLIITLGTTATEVLVHQKIKLKEVHGSLFYYQGVPLCPTFHPNAARYLKGGTQQIEKDISSILRKVGITTKQATLIGT